MQLRDFAHGRAGDKGDISNISVIAHRLADFPWLEGWLTAARVAAHFDGAITGRVERFALPQLGALNFVLHGALGGGVTRSLALDAHGKGLSFALLAMAVPDKACPPMPPHLGLIAS